MDDKALEIYKSMSQPPPEALKEIGAGRLKGFTDIKPQWRVEIMTRTFGLCGIGWKYTVDRQWTEPGVEGETFAFVNISLYIKDGDKWSDPIPSTGGSALIAIERAGLHGSDEAYKMATTDALGVSMSRIGVAADIYMGRWDGSKYRDDDDGDDADRLQDVRNSTGRLSPAIKEGEPAPKGDGTRQAMRDLWVKLNNLSAMKYEGADVFTPDQKKDLNADRHPGGKDPVPSKEALEHLQGVFDKWQTMADIIVERRKTLDAELEEGFNLAQDKVD